MTNKPTTFDEACEAWEPDLSPQPPRPIDVQQVIHALERARDRLQAEADAHAPDDYSAEFPSEDAECMREAIALLRSPPAAAQSAHRLTKADTVALWHAVDAMHWQIVGMREANKEEPGKFTLEQFAAEWQRMLAAKRALRKVNAIRKAQP